jgi:tetratricopeptide (TPR) repeat protein
MKTLAWVVLMVTLAATVAASKTVQEYVAEAQGYQAEGEPGQAAATMEQAATAYPEDATAHAYLGLYKGMQAGQAENFMLAGSLSSEAFAALNKALEIDPDHVEAHLFRGLMGVNVPEFLGLLDQGIEDLEFVVEAYDEAPTEVSKDLALRAYDFLGDGYLKKRDKARARDAWQRIVEIAPGTPAAEAAQVKMAQAEPASEPFGKSGFEGTLIEELKERSEAEPDNVDLLVGLGKAHMDAGEFAEAEGILRKATELDSENAAAYKWLGATMAMSMTGELYDERIHEDTDWATNMAFEIMGYLDKAVELAPEDLQARHLHGVMAINFPFFVGRLDQGLANLQMVVDSDVPDSIRAEAAYWLGYGYRKKGMSYWIEVVNKHPEEEAARMVFEGIRPPVRHFDPAEYDRPVVAVDFVLGFRDELPPQTVVWVETEAGELVRTIYISGFSGHAREVQVVLPVYASTAKYADVDASTGASIDIGEHIYTWDLKDRAGQRVDDGNYVIKVEVMYWPSNKYQLVSGTITIGESEDHATTMEGNFIPYLKVTYLP